MLLCITANSFGQQKKYVDDLYSTKSKNTPAATTSTTNLSIAPAKSDISKSNYQQQRNQPNNTLSNNLERNELITSYEESLIRRIAAYQSYNEMDKSYWDLMDMMNRVLTSKYDQSVYNTVVVGNEMWVEPRYISAIFDGSDPGEALKNNRLNYTAKNNSGSSSVNLTINVIDPFWGSSWYYPRYSYYRPYWDRWYGPNWGISVGWGSSWGYGPSWGWGSSWGYGPSWGWGPSWGYPHHHNYYPGHYPNYRPSRPVVWGNGHYGGGGSYGGGRPAESIRPNPGDRPSPGGGFRPNDNGTNVIVGGGRPSQNATRPSNNNNNQQQFTGERSYRNNNSYNEQRARPAQTPTPTRTPSYSGGNNGSYGGGGNGGGGGAGGFSTGGGGSRSR